MSAINHNQPIPADATRLAADADQTRISIGVGPAGDGDRSILAIQLGAQATPVATERYKIGDRIGGRYEVLAIHRGSMGVVYGTFDHTTQLPRALKTLQERFTSKVKLRDLFLEEASTWVILGKHPFIVRAYLVEKYDGQPYVITEYIRGEEGMGGDLQAWLGHRRLTLKLAVEMALQIAQGMQHAVRTIPGFVHRDLKPANVLVDNRARAMLTDFGLVCATEVEAGTPAYMAPELWKGESPDGRTDIYAFGCILYEMFTGHRMFSASSVAEWETAHLTQTPVAPITLRPDIPEETDAFVMQCLAKTPSARPQDWDTVVNEFAALFSRLTGQPAVLNFSAYELTISELISASGSLEQLDKYEEMLSISDRALKIDPNSVHARISKGSALNYLKRHEEAVTYFDSALEVDPNSADAAFAWSNKAFALIGLKRYDEAIVCCDRSIEIEPHDAVIAWCNKASALISLERYDEAIACSDRALEINPRFDPAWGRKGYALNELKRNDEAIACFDSAINIDPNSADAPSFLSNKAFALNSLNRHDEAIACCTRALEINPNHVGAWNNKGIALKSLNCHDEAIACYDRALVIDPDDRNLWNNKGSALNSKKCHDAAIACYDRALVIDPNFSDSWNNKGIALNDLKRHEEAIACCDRALEVDPNSARAWANKGSTLHSLERCEEAIMCFDRSLKIDPNSATVQANKGSAFNSLKRHEEAIICIDHALEINPFTDSIWNFKGSALYSLKRYDEAIACCDRALEINPNSDWAWAHKGRALYCLNKDKEAITCFNRALEIDPNSATAWANKGSALSSLKRHDEAISCFDCALVLDPISGSTWNNKGSALNHLNRDEEAIVCYDRALEILPNSATAWANKGVSLCCLCRYEEASACCDRALEIDPNSTTARNSKKAALNSLKPPVEASICIDPAQVIEPENVADLSDKFLEPVYAQLMSIHDSKESANRRVELFRLNVLPLLTDAALAQTATEQATNELFDAAASVLREIYTADWNSSHDLAAARATSDLALKFARGSETRQQILDDQAHFSDIQTERRNAKIKRQGLGILIVAAVIIGVRIFTRGPNTTQSISSPTLNPSSPSPENKTYRIPRSVSAEIAGDRVAIEQRKAALAHFKNKVDALGNEIEQERAYLDKTSQSAIDTFNSKVKNHNALLAQMRTQDDTLNQMIDSYNAKLQRYGR